MNWQDIIGRIFEAYGNPPKNILANLLGVNRSVISQWTTHNEALFRRPTWDILRKVVVDKGVAWDWLLEGKEEGNTKSPSALSSGERTLPKQKPPASRAGDELFSEKIKAIMEACTTIDAALRQCLIEAATGKIPEDDALDLFGEIVAQIKEFHDKKGHADIKQATA